MNVTVRWKAHHLNLRSQGLAVDPQGNIYVGETVPGQIGEMMTGHMVRKLVKN